MQADYWLITWRTQPHITIEHISHQAILAWSAAWRRPFHDFRGSPASSGLRKWSLSTSAAVNFSFSKATPDVAFPWLRCIEGLNRLNFWIWWVWSGATISGKTWEPWLRGIDLLTCRPKIGAVLRCLGHHTLQGTTNLKTTFQTNQLSSITYFGLVRQRGGIAKTFHNERPSH